MDAPQFDFAAYLARIGLPEVPAGIAGLRALQRSQMHAIAFENFDPLLGKVPELGLADISTKIVDGGRGGYCFELNGLFEAALKAAGFATRRVLARVRLRGDHAAPRSHLALRVEAEGRFFLADAGFGGPGPLEPVEIGVEGGQALANGVFRLVDDPASEELVLERQAGDSWQGLYGVDFAHVSDGEIAAANYFSATWDRAPFGSHAMLGAWRGETKLGLFDRSLSVEGAEGVERRELSDFEAFVSLIREDMGIALDRDALARVWEKTAQGQ
ncbi:MAG: arylamine N-acetyltransferase [Novosphingobium sp.]|nr:arylamine N-acetyltransferase [Novosphingobium sp.]